MFEIGQQVVCIDGRPPPPERSPGYGDEILPVEGRIYTIRGFESEFELGVYVEEIINKTRMYTCPDGVVREKEPSFGSRRFRPIRKTDIGIFTEMLVPVQPADAGQAPKKLEPA